jgi:tRNA(Arg) A34 adenosine deaminase TadA
MKIQDQVKIYLLETEGKYQVGQHEYYAWIALSQALKAFEENNYGIGAVAIQVTEKDIFEYRERNAMVTGLGVVDHAETRALLKLKSGKQPDYKYPRDMNNWTKSLPKGISVFGTLEPCPMCSCTLTNVGAMLSVSTVRDGNLIVTEQGYKISDGAANVIVYKEPNVSQEEVIMDKFKIQPQIWQWIQTAHKLKFEILETTDQELKELSMKIFTETREQIDRQLAERGLQTYTENRAKSLFIK